MWTKILKLVVAISYIILFGLAIYEIPDYLKIIGFGAQEGNQIGLFNPQRIWMKISFDFLKIILIPASAILYFFNSDELKHNIFKVAIVVLLFFLFFDLPLHKCYNGNFESFWQIGNHLH